MTSPVLPDLNPPVEPQQQPSTSTVSSIVLYASFGLLLAGPLAFGAVEPWAIFALEIGSAALLATWAIQQAASGELAIEHNALFTPMLAFAGVIGLQVIAGQSAYRYQTLSTAGLYAAYGLICFLVVQAMRRTRQIKVLVIAVTSYGFVLATFALVQGMASNGKLYWLRTPHSGGWIYGPYVNHNHYAGLMEMLVPIPLIYALTRGARGPRRVLAAVAAAIMACTIFLSGSRGGMVAFAVQMAVLAAILASDRLQRKKALLLGSFLVVVAVLLAWMGGGELAKRMASIHSETHQELTGGMRVNIDRDSLHMFLHRPWLGWGLGNFPEAFPQFRTFYTTSFVNEAHNDYLQLLVETGVAGFAVMLWYLIVLYRNALKKLNDWAHDTNGAVSLACILGCTGILVHSFVDFNLQIPANALLFYVLAAVAAMKDRFSHPRRKTGIGHGAIIEIPVTD